MVNSELPFGGVGTSGSGAYNGPHGFAQCSHMRAISDAWVVNAGPFMTRFPPFTPTKQANTRLLFKYLAQGQWQIIKKVALCLLLVILLIIYSIY